MVCVASTYYWEEVQLSLTWSTVRACFAIIIWDFWVVEILPTNL